MRDKKIGNEEKLMRDLIEMIENYGVSCTGFELTQDENDQGKIQLTYKYEEGDTMREKKENQWTQKYKGLYLVYCPKCDRHVNCIDGEQYAELFEISVDKSLTDEEKHLEICVGWDFETEEEAMEFYVNDEEGSSDPDGLFDWCDRNGIRVKEWG